MPHTSRHPAPHNMPSLVKPSTFGLQRQCPVTNDCTDSASRRAHLSSDRRSSRSHDAGTCSPLSTVDVTTLFWILRSPTTVIWVSPFFYNFRFAVRLVSICYHLPRGVTRFLLFFILPSEFPANKGGSANPLLGPFSLLPPYHLTACIHARSLCRIIVILSPSHHSTCAPQQCLCGAGAGRAPAHSAGTQNVLPALLWHAHFLPRCSVEQAI